MAGFPPLSGFWAKFLLVDSAVQNDFYIGIAVIITASLMTFYYMSYIWYQGFCKASRNDKHFYYISAQTKSITYICIGLLTLIMLYIGFFPNALITYLEHLSGYLQDNHLYINALLHS